MTYTNCMKASALLPIAVASAAHAFGTGDATDLETGMVFSSSWLAVRSAAATLGYVAAEQIDVTLGTLETDDGSRRGAGSTTYYLAQNRFGFGVSAEYRTVDDGSENLINSIALGLGAEPVQAGINLIYNATTWETAHTLNIRAGRENGLAGAIRVGDISTLNERFDLGIGYRDAGKFAVELGCPIDTDAIFNAKSFDVFVWEISVSVLSIPKAALNFGISGIRFGEEGDGNGKAHAGASYWFNDKVSFVATINKRHVLTLGILANVK